MSHTTSQREAFLDAVREELSRQDVKWGPKDSPAFTTGWWYTVLSQEVGEVASAILECAPSQCMAEAVQVAACAYHVYLSSMEDGGVLPTVEAANSGQMEEEASI